MEDKITIKVTKRFIFIELFCALFFVSGMFLIFEIYPVSIENIINLCFGLAMIAFAIYRLISLVVLLKSGRVLMIIDENGINYKYDGANERILWSEIKQITLGKPQKWYNKSKFFDKTLTRTYMFVTLKKENLLERELVYCLSSSFYTRAKIRITNFSDKRLIKKINDKFEDKIEIYNIKIDTNHNVKRGFSKENLLRRLFHRK